MWFGTKSSLLTAEERAAEEVKARKAAEARAFEREDRKRERAAGPLPEPALRTTRNDTRPWHPPTKSSRRRRRVPPAGSAAQAVGRRGRLLRDPNKLPQGWKRQVEDNAALGSRPQALRWRVLTRRKRINPL